MEGQAVGGLPLVLGGGPRVSDTYNPAELPILYQDILKKNPLLARIEAGAKVQMWDDLSIRTLQLHYAIVSNASMQQRISELEALINKKILT